MANECPVPGCEVLLMTNLPMCTKHWNSVPEPIRKALDAADRKLIQATTDHDRNVARVEKQAALDMAIGIAAGNKTPGPKGSISKNSTGKTPA